jgi:hypothetical protein
LLITIFQQLRLFELFLKFVQPGNIPCVDNDPEWGKTPFWQPVYYSAFPQLLRQRFLYQRQQLPVLPPFSIGEAGSWASSSRLHLHVITGKLFRL